MINKEFSAYIKSRRLEIGLSIRALADKCSINYTRLSKIENGLRPVPDVNALICLAQALGLTPDYLIKKAGIVNKGILVFNETPQSNENIVPAEIISWADGLAELKDICGHLYTVVADIRSGKVKIFIPLEGISLFTDDSHVLTSSRNRIEGIVKKIDHHAGVSIVTVVSKALELRAKITNKSLEMLAIKINSPIVCRFKATACRIEP
jgi:transcriptional regulator with XRE-family HTH domain